MPDRLRTVALLLCSLALGACANQEKAEFSLLLNTAAKHPVFLQAMTRQNVAKILAGMDLTAAQAAGLKRWAATDGAAVRQEIDAKAATLDALAPKLNQTADALISERAVTEAAQEELLNTRLGDDRPLTDEAEPPVQIEELLEPHLGALRPTVAALSDRQQLVAIGHWSELVRVVSDYVTYSKDDLEAMGDQATGEVVGTLLQARGYGVMPDEDLHERVTAMAAKLPTGRDEPGDVEPLVVDLIAQLPAQDADSQIEAALVTLGTVLLLEPAPELLALIK